MLVKKEGDRKGPTTPPLRSRPYKDDAGGMNLSSCISDGFVDS